MQDDDVMYLSDKCLNIRRLEHAIVLPGVFFGGGVVHDGQLLRESMLNRGHYKRDGFSMPNDIQQDSRKALYLGDFCACWGHCLTDCLKHAWALLPKYRQEWNRDEVAFVYTTCWPDEEISENFFQCWEALGLSRNKMIRIVKPVQFEMLYFPEESFWLERLDGFRCCSAQYTETIDAIRNHFVPSIMPPYRVIYFSRRRWTAKKSDFGEQGLEDAICRATGAESVSPETLTLQELVKLMGECKILITTEGSVSHNAVFMQDCSELVILKKANYVNGYQPPINQMRKLKVTWLRAHMSKFLEYPDRPWLGPFYLCVTRDVATFFGIHTEIDFIAYFRYFLYFIKKRFRHALVQIKHIASSALF